MSYRVQFTITNEEYDELKKEARELGYPNVAQMAKDLVLRKNNSKESYGEKYILMVKKIESLAPNTEFLLRDIIEVPPALLGRWLYEGVRDGKIKNVRHLGNNGSDAERYLKL